MIVKSKSLERLIKSIIPSNVKKITSNFLCSKKIGEAIQRSGFKYNLHGGIFDYSLVSPEEAAAIFFGIWESAEIRIAKRFINEEIVVELGSSVGVTLGVLSNKRLTPGTYTCVEASPLNFEKLCILQNACPERHTYSLINKAIAYGKSRVDFNCTSTTGSKVSSDPHGENVVTITATTLRDLLDEQGITKQFALITDIEGAEADIFYEDVESLENCNKIVAELEDVERATIEDQIKQLEEIGFSLVERYANVVCMQRF